MTEERLKEIKDSIDYGVTGAKLQALKHAENVYNEELELYNEVVRLREIIDKATEYIEKDYYTIDVGDIVKKDLLDILKQNNLTLEQLNGIENK